MTRATTIFTANARDARDAFFVAREAFFVARDAYDDDALLFALHVDSLAQNASNAARDAFADADADAEAAYEAAYEAAFVAAVGAYEAAYDDDGAVCDAARA